MQNTTHKAAGTLKHLVETCRDGQAGFQAAADAVGDSTLRAEFTQYSRQRENFALDLEAALHSIGESSDGGGSFAGAVHRGWMKLEAGVSDSNRYAVLAECERGEDAAVKAYRDAISGDLTGNLESIVRSQYEQLQRAHDRVKELRDAARRK